MDIDKMLGIEPKLKRIHGRRRTRRNDEGEIEWKEYDNVIFPLSKKQIEGINLEGVSKVQTYIPIKFKDSSMFIPVGKVIDVLKNLGYNVDGLIRKPGYKEYVRNQKLFDYNEALVKLRHLKMVKASEEDIEKLKQDLDYYNKKELWEKKQKKLTSERAENLKRGIEAKQRMKEQMLQKYPSLL